MIVERKKGSSRTMTFLVGIKFLLSFFFLANDPLMCELENTVHVCIYNATMLILSTFVYNLALGSDC